MKTYAGKAHIRVLAVAAAAGALLATVGVVVAVASSGSHGQTSIVRVVEKEMTTSMKPSSVPAGRVTFIVRNGGNVEHELVVLRGAGRAHVSHFKALEGGRNLGEVEDVEPGKTKSFTVTLKPGKYTLLCNIAGHYMLGMHSVLTVR
jgi:uncharacterized cupredoxin-like copper-binding protein